MNDCAHLHFDFDVPARGPGFVTCADCGKSIPMERALYSLAYRIDDLERWKADVTAKAKERKNAEQ